MSYSQNAVSFVKPWKVRQISIQTFIASWRSCWQWPFPQRLLSGHSVQWGVLRHVYEVRGQKTDRTCSHKYSHRFGNRQWRSTKTIWCNWQKENKLQLEGQRVLAVTHYFVWGGGGWWLCGSVRTSQFFSAGAPSTHVWWSHAAKSGIMCGPNTGECIVICMLWFCSLWREERSWAVQKWWDFLILPK